jgi:pseudomonalisin
MQSPERSSPHFFIPFLIFRARAIFLRVRILSAVLLLASLANPALTAQTANRITQPIDRSRVQALPAHHPLWAIPADNVGLVPADLPLNQLTLVLARSPQQQAAFEQFLADQQNPASPDYHHWLTPEEVGARFGHSDQDITALTGWLQSQGLRVNWIAPNRIFIGFGGTAANIGRAFQTEMHYYSVRGTQRLSVNSDPMVPTAIAPAIKAIRGLYTIDEQPDHHVGTVQSATPQLTTSNGTHYLTPADFNAIYDVPSNLTGAGVTIGIVSWAHTNFADFDNFRSKTGAAFPNPTEVVPTTYGGIDPGPALTAPPSGSSSTLTGQQEATLDVLRAGSVAPAASLLLVISSPSGSNDGIGADAQYLVNTSPVPAQVMSISFGACESSAGSGGVAFWNGIFQAAAAEGISIFVSSDDSGSAGCDTAFAPPPASPQANSPNYICSSSYATCVGGTEFADTVPSTYWSSTNSTGYQSVYGYIPEGAWNESTSTYVAGTGGGVSLFIPTPSWQTVTGVPSPAAGRYTPDVSFSASAHDGYFACMAALSGSCVTTNQSFSFISFSGTSAAAPGMAGVAALLDQKLGAPQGNLNPGLYATAAQSLSAFHDVNVSSSGVTSCNLNTASLCNNSMANASGGGAQPGFQVTNGYDEATGLGSLDVQPFLSNYATDLTPAVTVTPSAPSITFQQPLTVTVTVSAENGYAVPTGSVVLTGGSYTSAPVSLAAGSATINIAAGSLATGTDALTVTYTPDATSSAIFYGASGTTSVTVTLPAQSSFTIAGPPITIATPGATTGNTSTITITPTNGFTGSVMLTASITNPSGAQYQPTVSFSTNPVNLNSAGAVTTTLTVATTASQTSSCVADNQSPHGIPWYAQDGAVLACAFLFGIAPKRRAWRAMLGMTLLFVALASGITACSGGSKSTSCAPTTTSGTTAGSYTITITGTSGATTVTSAPIAVTVQ